MSNFSNRFKILRTSKRLTQDEIAKKLGMSKSTISMYENGNRAPDLETLEAIADFFNVTIDYLTGKEDRSLYYLDPEVAEKAQELYEDPSTRILLDAKRDLSKEDLDYLIRTLNILKEKDNGRD